MSPSAGTVGPRMSLSDGGWSRPRLGGVPPAVRKRALAVIVCSRLASSSVSSAVESKDATQVNACLLAGPGLSTPDWFLPWNGYDARCGRVAQRGRVGALTAGEDAADQRGACGAGRGALDELAAAEVHGFRLLGVVAVCCGLSQLFWSVSDI